jgi:hypothetical protein
MGHHATTCTRTDYNHSIVICHAHFPIFLLKKTSFILQCIGNTIHYLGKKRHLEQ